MTLTPVVPELMFEAPSSAESTKGPYLKAYTFSPSGRLCAVTVFSSSTRTVSPALTSTETNPSFASPATGTSLTYTAKLTDQEGLRRRSTAEPLSTFMVAVSEFSRSAVCVRETESVSYAELR